MTTNSAVPFNQRYFEDYVVGASSEYGEISLSADEIMEFARRFDPQPIHVDPEAAARGPFAGLIASGWHTAGAMMRLLADHFISHVASMASPGVDEIRWFIPVRPGDVVDPRYGPGNQAFALEARSGNRAQPRRGTKSKQRSCHESETGEHGEMPHLTPRPRVRRFLWAT